MPEIEKGKLVYPKGNGTPGHTTGGTRSCGTAGCTSERVGVRWPDGNLTWVCRGWTEYLEEKDVYRLIPQSRAHDKATVPENPYEQHS